MVRRRRRGVGEVLDGGADRAAQPRRRRCVLPGLRRLERPARQCERRLARTIVQTCLIHLIRNTFSYASRKYWDELSRDLKPIYTAVNADAAAAALDDLDAKWGARYPAIIRLWRNAWEEFIPFLDYDVEIRKVLCSTNAIESLNARYRRAVKARGHFPTEQAAMKCLYLVTRSLDPKGTGQTRWAVRWKPALNAFAITFADRMPTKND